MMREVQLPLNGEKRKNLYSMMLGLNKNNKLTFGELQELCLKRGYLTKEGKLIENVKKIQAILDKCNIEELNKLFKEIEERIDQLGRY